MRENLRENLRSGGKDTSDIASLEPSDPIGGAAAAPPAPAPAPAPANAPPATTDRLVSLRKAVLEV